jgi:hypothetical protein
VIVVRPSVYKILQDLITCSKDGDSVAPVLNSYHSKTPEVTEVIAIDDEESALSVSQKLPYMKLGDRLAVCASGPASLTTEIANAVSRVQLSKKGRGLGMIGLHTEVFAL